MRLLGAILAGGAAQRFGSDKGLALLAGRTLIEHAADRLRPRCTDIVVCGREVAPGGYVTTADAPAPRLGPLGGLCGALRYAAEYGFDAVLTIGCDTPAIPSDLLESVIAARPGFVRQMPVVGCWPTELTEQLAAYVVAGDRSVRGWGAAVGATVIDAGGEIVNINRPADLAALR